MGAYTQLIYHVVFGTKFRRPIIRSEIQERLYEYIGGIIRAKQGHLIEIGGVADHIHVLTGMPPTITVSDFVRDLKANSARWLNELNVIDQRFEWQKGYGAFTVSYSQVEQVRQYIQNQQEHHRVTTFAQEYVLMLERHGIEFERRYLFEGEHHG